MARKTIAQTKKRWPINKAYFWQTTPFFRLLLPLAAGIFYYYSPLHIALPLSICLSIIAVAFVSCFALLFNKKGSFFYTAISFSLLNIFLFFSGICISGLADIRNNKAWFGNDPSSNSAYLATLSDAPLEKENSWKLPVMICSRITGGKPTPACGKAFLYVYKNGPPMLLHQGDTILTPGNWQPIQNAGNPFEFDYSAYCRLNNIFYVQYGSVNSIRLYAAAGPGSESILDKSHHWCAAQLDKYLTDAKARGLIQAMLLGDEVNLDEDLRQSYAETGIIHIIAISGGNIAIFFMAVSWLLWWLRDRKHVWVKFAVALPLVWFYVLMAGAPPSAVRAAIMFSLLAFSVLLQKNSNSLNQLFATAFLLLCAQPAWLFSAGFQLSFMAVLSIILFYRPVFRLVILPNKVASWLWRAAAAGIAAEILVAPVVIYYFHTFPLLFIIANVAAYLFMSIALILGIAIIAFSFLPAMARIIGMITTGIVTFFDKMVNVLQSFNPVSFHFITLKGVELLLVYAVISGAGLFLMRKQRPALFAALIAACLLFALFCRDEWQRLHQYRFVVYNTGKGNHMERIAGSKYTVLNTDTAAAKKMRFVLNPAHTGWQAWENDSGGANEIIDVNGKTALILNQDVATGSRFPVSYLVINFNGDPDPVKLQQIFSPALIIIGNNYTRRQQDKFAQKCTLAGIAVHTASRDGAFEISNLYN